MTKCPACRAARGEPLMILADQALCATHRPIGLRDLSPPTTGSSVPPPPPTLRDGETPPSAWHMAVYSARAPDAPRLVGRYHRIGLSSRIVGAQHNPSVFVDGGLFVTVRVLHEHKTTNYIAAVTPDWNLTGEQLLAQKARPSPQLEDLRPFIHNRRLMAVAAAHPGEIPARSVRQAIIELFPGLVGEVHLQPSVRNEKNWMPLVRDNGELVFVYSVKPLVILRSDRDGVFWAPEKHPAGMIRGGSQLVPWRDGYVAIVHQVYKPPRDREGHNALLGFWADPAPESGPPVTYLHRFVYFDRDLTSVQLGRLFFFREPGIEFCAGLVRWEGQYVAAFGVADKEAWLVEVAEETIAAMLEEETNDGKP